MAARTKTQTKTTKLDLQQEADWLRCQKDPAWMVRTQFGDDLWDDQIRIIESVRDHPRTAWRSCHGIGKTFVVARLVLWWLYSFPYSIVITTAPTWRQVQDLVWKEIRSCHYRSRRPLGGHLSPMATELSLDGKEWIAIGLSTNESNRFQGYHAEHLLVIVDEASGVREDIFEAIEGVLTSAHCRLVLIGNPTDIGGTFYRAFRNEGWSCGHTSAWDTPNFTVFGITRADILNGNWKTKVPKREDGEYDFPYPYLITPKWAAEAFQNWGEHHPAWSARVEGDFPEQGEYNVIPLSWIEQAQIRWQDAPDTNDGIVLGVDVARGGMDLSAIAARQGSKIQFIHVFHGLDGPQLAAEVAIRYRTLQAVRANIDIIGLGASCYDALVDNEVYKDLKVIGTNVARKSFEVDEQGNRKFQNLRAELWWTLREALQPINPEVLSLPPGDIELLSDLAAPMYDMKPGWIKIEAKEDTKARLGRSPDRGDAVMLTFAPADEYDSRASPVVITKEATYGRF